MKYLPIKYTEIARKDPFFKLSEWEFIKMNLNVLNFDEDELINVFGISKSELSNWKTEHRNIPISKIAVLCSMFDITIDQYLDRDSSFDEYFRHKRLSLFRDSEYWKKTNINEIVYLFDQLQDACWTMDSYVRGYYDVNDKKGTPFDAFDDLKFSCLALDMDVTFDYENCNEMTVSTISYKELCEIVEKLKLDWGEAAQDHFFAWPSDKYIHSLLLTENLKYIEKFDNFGLYTQGELLEAWAEIKNDNPSFDKDYRIAKQLLANGASLDSYDDPNKAKTLELCLEIMRHDTNTQKQTQHSEVTEKEIDN